MASSSSTTDFKAAPINLLTFNNNNNNNNNNDSNAIRTVPELIEFNAKHNPEQIFCLQAVKGSTQDAGPIAISHLQLRHAISRCSKRLLAEIEEINTPRKDGEGKILKCSPVALFMESDVGLLIHLFALMSLGIPVALLSARLSSTAVHHLLAAINAKAIITAPQLSNTVIQALSVEKLPGSPASIEPVVYLQKSYQYDVVQTDVPNSDLASDTICDPNHLISETDRNVLILHSSGTTGLPKPIYQPHRYLLGFARCHERTSAEDVGGLNVSTLPLYHGFGLLAPLLSLGVGKPFWMAPAHVVPTGASTIEALRSTGAKSLMSVPHILEEISLLPNDEGTKALLPLQFVASGGGPLKVSVGEKLSTAGVKVLAHFGATEIGPVAPIFSPTAEYDWHYWRIRKDYNFKLELIVESDAGSEQVVYKLTAYPFGWDTPFVLQDRLQTNPKNPGSDFKAMGRNDDLIVLGTGEKVLPRILESLLCESSLVKTAVAFGEGQFELGVIVEPVTTPKDTEEFITSIIWPIIQEAGNKMDDHARISSKTSIIITPPGKPIPRSDKGSVLRKEAYRIFDEEIKQVYKDLDDSSIVGGGGGTSAYSLDPENLNLEETLKDMIQDGMNWPPIGKDEWGVEDDLFELGMRSLQAMRLRRLLLGSIKNNRAAAAFPAGVAEAITNDFVYKNPSVARIAEALRELGDKKGLGGTSKTHGKTIEDFVAKYVLEKPSSPATRAGSVVLLTGSTGSLGTHILAHLASLPNVSRVICLNRRPVVQTVESASQDPLEQQFKTAEAKGVNIPPQDRSKISVLQTDPSATRLGLQDTEYSKLRSEVTHILHGAWPMDFKRMLPSFESQFRFLHNLLSLAKEAHELRPLVRPRILFVSSIAVVGQYAKIHGTRMVPEVPVEDSRCTNHFGYGKAKLVCERIIEDAARTHQKEMEVLCVRVGQMSGSSKSGFWNPNEHFPALVQASQNISKLPRIEGTLSWTPVDTAAIVLCEQLLTPQPVDLIYHLENPIRQSWHEILLILASKLGLTTEFLPFDDWLSQVSSLVSGSSSSSSSSSSSEEDKLAANMLAEFFKEDFQHMSGGEVILDTQKSRDISPTLHGIDAVKGELVARYVDQWRKLGFLK